MTSKTKEASVEPRRSGTKHARRGAGLLATIKAALAIDLVSFRGKVVLITGGSRGLGLVMARRLAREGARLALIARDEEELGRAKDDLRRRGFDAMTVKCDVRDRAQVVAAVRAVVAELGPVEVLINNAGTITVGPMESMTPEDFDDAMKTHFHGPLAMTLAVLPEMRRMGRGRIVNISSLGGQIPVPHMLPYVASKFALTGMSQGMRAELMKDGIAVTTVCPGMLRTGSVYNAFFKGKNRAEMTWFALLGSLPPFSMNADRAARIILRAARFGRAQVTVTTLGKIAARTHGLFPGIVADNMGLTNRFLPAEGGIGTRRARGRDSLSRLASSFLTILTQRAARMNNELSDSERIGTARFAGGQSAHEKGGSEKSSAGHAGPEKSGSGTSGSHG